MPISPENRKLYPPRKEWLAIRESILLRAGMCCEHEGCLALHRAYGTWEGANFDTCSPVMAEMRRKHGEKVIRIILTIAHLDHDPTNNDPANLRAFCQRHHNRHDAKHRAVNAAATRAKKRAQAEGGK